LSEYKGKIALGAVLALATAVSLAFVLNAYLPASFDVPTSIGQFGPYEPQTYCGSSIHASGGSYGGGYSMIVNSTTVPFGGKVCIYTHLQNHGNDSTSPPANETIVVTYAENPGVVYYKGSCIAPPNAEPFGPNSTGWNCVAIWDTSNGYNGIRASPIISCCVGANEFLMQILVHLRDSSTTVGGGGTIYLALSNSTTTTTTTTPSYSCGGPTFKRLTPTQGGPIYLKIVTDQGSAVPDNGTVFVTHAGPKGTANYCLGLPFNATGYVGLAASDGLAQTGSYNMSLFAGYNQGPGYQGTLPAFTVQPNTTVYVTVSVPSGTVTIESCPQGGNSCTTTTATATTIGSG
jgi:hypothetical protein